MPYYLKLEDGSSVWSLSKLSSNLTEAIVVLTDGTEETVGLIETSKGGWGSKWLHLPPGRNPVRIVQRIEQTVIDGYVLAYGEEAASVTFPATLTVAEYRARMAQAYDADDDEGAALLRRLYRQGDSHAVEEDRVIADGMNTWAEVNVRGGWIDPDPTEAWTPSAIGDLYGPALAHLFPGAVDLTGAFVKALKDASPGADVFEQRHDTRNGTVRLACHLKVRYAPDRTTTVTKGKGRKAVTTEVPSLKTIRSEFVIPATVAGENKADAIARREKVVDQLVKQYVPFARVCGACNGEGWITQRGTPE